MPLTMPELLIDKDNDNEHENLGVDCLVLGAGQLGQCLRAAQPTAYEIHYCDRAALDITDSAQVTAMLQQLQPQVVINATAYTAVDKAETEIGQAFQVNAMAVQHLAAACASVGAVLIHISTDFVFGGQDDSARVKSRQPRPWRPTDQAHPMGVYGASKLVGEQAILATANLKAYIIRTSWLYSEYGNNFVKTMLRLMAERDALGVVNDQIGSPTDSLGLAKVLWELAAANLKGQPTPSESIQPGIYHWSDAGVISWHDFAVEIQRLALQQGLLKKAIPINPIGTADYPTPARRPAYSVLDCSELVAALNKPQTDWQLNLQRVLGCLAADTN